MRKRNRFVLCSTLLLLTITVLTGCGKKTCSKPGCENEVYNKDTGLCFDHTMERVEQIDKYYDAQIDYYQGLLDKLEQEEGKK